MKKIWENTYTHAGKTFRIALFAWAGNLYIKTFNANGHQIVIRTIDEQGNPMQARLSATMEWMMADDLEYNGQDPDYWLNAMVRRLENTIKFAIDHDEALNL